MSTIVLDTLKYASKLKAGGFNNHRALCTEALSQ
jgi:hypothetical protein